jgi:site-specific DNA-cytosine methylase
LRELNILEYERLQTLPDEYTLSASLNERKKMIGNGWTVDVIAHIFKNIQ